MTQMGSLAIAIARISGLSELSQLKGSQSLHNKTIGGERPAGLLAHVENLSLKNAKQKILMQ